MIPLIFVNVLNTKTCYIREVPQDQLSINHCGIRTIRSHLPVYFFCSVNLALSFSNKTILVTMEEYVEVCTCFRIQISSHSILKSFGAKFENCLR